MPDIAPPPARGATSAGSYVFELPSLGADMETGTVLQWYVDVGDTVARGDVVALVSTEKADIDVEIWHGGRIVEQLVEIGTAVPVGTPLLRLERAGAAPPPATPPPPPPSPRVPTLTAAAPPPVAAPAPAGDRPLSSPLARVLAAERGIDLATVTGSGPDGAITARDVAAAPPPTPPTTPTGGPPPAPVDPAAAMRRAIAARMDRSNREIPHYHLDLDIDVTDALARLGRYNAERPVADRLLPAAVLAWATARAAARVPELNGHWLDDTFQPHRAVDLGIVVSLRRGGLVTPTITDADQLDPAQLMAELGPMVTAARTGALRSSWMADASLTATILGDNGADRVSGLIFPPQVALVGFGRIRRGSGLDAHDNVLVRSWVTVTLAADHRATDGATGSRFLIAIRQALDEALASPEIPRTDP